MFTNSTVQVVCQIEQQKHKSVFKTSYYRELAERTILTVPIFKIIISNPIHTNTTPEHYTLLYYDFILHVSALHSIIIR